MMYLFYCFYFCVNNVFGMNLNLTTVGLCQQQVLRRSLERITNMYGDYKDGWEDVSDRYVSLYDYFMCDHSSHILPPENQL